MPHYRDKDADGRHDEIIVIEDKSMVRVDEEGNQRVDFAMIDEHTIRAHPMIIDVLLENAERLWTLDEVLRAIEPSIQAEELN